MVIKCDNDTKLVKKHSMGQVGVCGITNPQINSPDSTVNDEMSSSSQQGKTDLQATLSSLASEENRPAQDEIMKKFSTVVNQNLQLKESLYQNNLAMRQQLGLIVQWSQNQRTWKQQQLLQAMRQISLLKQENNNLKAAKEGIVGEKLPPSVDEEKLKSAEFQVRQLQEDRSSLENIRTKLEADIVLLKCDLSNAKGVQEQLQLQCSHLLAANGDLKSQLNQLVAQQHQGSSLETKAHQEEQVIPLKREVEELKSQLCHVKRQLQEAQMTIQSQDSSSSEQDRVGTLEQTLGAERKKLAEERELAGRLASEVAGLKYELQDAKDTIHRNANTDQYYQTKIKAINEEHDAVTAKLLSYEELLSAKNEELMRLKKECGQAKAKVAESENEGETLAVLRAQVEVYQADFRAEREAREALASEREQLRDELKQLHARNTQLLDEMQAAQIQPSSFSLNAAKSSSEVNASQSAPTPQEAAQEDVVDESLFYCPKCNKSFGELRPLEEHVNRCLDDD